MANYRFERIKREVDGVQYLSKYIRMKRVGLVYKAVCPFHNEKTGSLTIYPPEYIKDGKQQGYTSFYCFGCGCGGDILDFKRLKENYSKEEACTELEEEYGFSSDDDEALKSFMEEEIKRIENSYGNILSLTEINLVCSSICRNNY
jgi:DNA primase